MSVPTPLISESGLYVSVRARTTQPGLYLRVHSGDYLVRSQLFISRVCRAEPKVRFCRAFFAEHPHLTFTREDATELPGPRGENKQSGQTS